MNPNGTQQDIIEAYFREKSALAICAALVSRPTPSGQRESTPRQIADQAVLIAEALAARLKEKRN